MMLAISSFSQGAICPKSNTDKLDTKTDGSLRHAVARSKANFLACH